MIRPDEGTLWQASIGLACSLRKFASRTHRGRESCPTLGKNYGIQECLATFSMCGTDLKIKTLGEELEKASYEEEIFEENEGRSVFNRNKKPPATQELQRVECLLRMRNQYSSLPLKGIVIQFSSVS